MSRLASILCLAGCIIAANAASSVPIATQPILSTVIVSTVSDALSTSLSTILSTSTIVIYGTSTSGGKIVSSSIGTQLSIFASTSAIVTSATETELSTIISTIGSTTIYGAGSSTSSTIPTSTGVIPPPVAVTSSQTPATTPVNVVTSTASLPSTGITQTPTAATTSAASTNTASPEKSSKKKISGGAAAGIAIGVAVIIGGIAGALVIFLRKRRQQKKWGRTGTRDSVLDGESKTDLFSPDARSGYDSMWKKPAAAMLAEKNIQPGTAMSSIERILPVNHERCDSSTLGIDAPSIATSASVSSPKTDSFGDKPVNTSKIVPNFSTPTRRSSSMTALPQQKP